MVLAALEAACTDEFNIHGVLATTMPVGPVIIVNGPIRSAIGMNCGGNVLGQGNRANLTIGRAAAARHPQRRRRPARRGRPRRARQPGQARRSASPRTRRARRGTSLAVERGFAPDASTVTLFPGEGPRCVVDQLVARARGAWRARSPRACAPCTTRSCRSASTPCSSSAPSTPACSRTRAGRTRAGAGRAPEHTCSSPAASSSAAPAASPRACPERLRDADPAEVPPRRPADRARRRRRRTVLCHHRRLGQRCDRQPAHDASIG